jgi:hypothetical protein
MAKNPLEELIKNRTPKYGELGSGQEAVSTDVARAGNFQVNTGPYEKTNAALQFAEGLNKLPDVYDSAVKARQKDAAIKVAQMDEGEFKEAYQKIIAGDVADTASLFGYTKAHQQKIVERYHNEVVPLELKDISRDFRNKLNDYPSIIDFDEDVEATVDAYYREVGERFNASPFTEEAHGLLSIGKAAKLKVELHDAYEAQALEYIKGQSISNGVKALEDMQGNVDGVELTLNAIHADAKASTGSNADANAITVASVNSRIETLIAEGTSETLDEAAELLEYAYDGGLEVANKDIFETADAREKEIQLRVKLAGALRFKPQQITAEAKAFHAEHLRAYATAKTPKARAEALVKWNEAKDAIKEAEVWQMATKFQEEALSDPLFSAEEFAKEAVEEFLDDTSDRKSISNVEIQSFLQQGEFSIEDMNLLLPRSADDTGVAPTPSFNKLSGEAIDVYRTTLNAELINIFSSPEYETDEERTAAGLEAKQRVYDQTQDYVINRARSLISQEKPKKETDQKVSDLKSFGASPKQIEQYRKLRIQDSPSAEQYFEQVKDTRLGNDIKKLYDVKSDGSVSININDWWFVSSDYVQIGENFNKLVQARVFKDEDNQREQHQRVLEFINSRSKVGDESIYAALANGEQQGYKDMLTLIKLRGISEEAFLTGVVSGGYTMSYPDVSPIGAGGGVPMQSRESSDTYLGMILIEDNLYAEDIDKFPIALDGDINKTIEAIESGAAFAFKDIAEKLGVTPESVLEAQKAYLKTLGYFTEDNTVDNDDDPTDDDEKKSNVQLDSSVSADTVIGMGDLNDLSGEGAQFKIQENYSSLAKTSTDKDENTFQTTFKDFMRQYYENNVNHKGGKEGIGAAFDRKFEQMVNRDPKLLQLLNQNVTLSFDMSEEDQSSGKLGYYTGDFKTKTGHITISPSLNYKKMEQIIAHELIHSLQYNVKNRKGLKTNPYTNQIRRPLDYTAPKEDFLKYLQSEVESEARMAEVARYYAEKTGTMLGEGQPAPFDQYHIKGAFKALVHFMTNDSIADHYRDTQEELYKILQLKTPKINDSMTPLQKRNQRNNLRKELSNIPDEQLEPILGSIATLASNNPIQNSNQQLA